MTLLGKFGLWSFWRRKKNHQFFTKVVLYQWMTFDWELKEKNEPFSGEKWATTSRKISKFCVFYHQLNVRITEKTVAAAFFSSLIFDFRPKKNWDSKGNYYQNAAKTFNSSLFYLNSLLDLQTLFSALYLFRLRKLFHFLGEQWKNTTGFRFGRKRIFLRIKCPLIIKPYFLSKNFLLQWI